MSAAVRPLSIRALKTMVPFAAAAALAGCGEGPMSILDPAGPGAEPITRVWWVMAIASIVILVGVTALALHAVYRRPDETGDRRTRLYIIGGGLVFPSTTLVLLLAYGIHSGHALLPLETDRDVYRVEVIGHQWWWEVRYPDAEGGPLYSANELHIPAGRPVDVHVDTADVIHSFWVPRLGGKIDAIPGRTNVIRLEAAAPGMFRGQCAEFCGAQHSRMALHVEAHDEDALAERLARLAGSGDAAVPQPETAGRTAFETHCADCHSRDPTERSIGPNLADLSYRPALGAGTLGNDPAGLRNWIQRHHALKPGNRMPSFDHLDAETIESIADHLEGER